MSKKEEIIKILNKLNKKYFLNNEEIISQCPFHSPDINPSFSINYKTGLYICFACGEKGNFNKFIKYFNIKLYSTKTLKNHIKELKILKISKQKNIKKEKIKFDLLNLGKCPKINKQDINYLELIKRKFRLNFNTIKKFDLKMGISKFSNRIIIPIYNEKGIISYSARLIFGKGEKYLNRKNFKFSQVLFNNHFYRNFYKTNRVYKDNRIFIVEGFFDCMYLTQIGLNSFSIFGTNLSEIQYKLIKKFEFKKIILLFDMDEAGFEGYKKLDNKFQDLYYSIYKGNLRKLKENKINIFSLLSSALLKYKFIKN